MRSGASLADGGIARPCSVIDPPSNALRRYGQVVRNLGWDKLATKMIFSHTQQPLNGALDEACGDVRFWNTGSWIYEPRIESQDSWERYLDLGWPGTAVLIDTERATRNSWSSFATRTRANTYPTARSPVRSATATRTLSGREQSRRDAVTTPAG